MLSFRFDDTREAFREALARFTRERVAPGYRDRAAKDVYPMELHRDLAEMGVLGIGLPEEFGGTGPEDPLTLGIACEELAAGDPNLAAAPVQTGLIGTQIAKGGTPAVRRRWLPPLMEGRALAAIALTEPDSGSDAAALRTTASPTPGGFVLSGEKTSVSHVKFADVAVIYARRPGTARSQGVSAFLVELDRPGVTVGSFHDMGQLPIGRGTLHLDDVFVPGEHLLGEEGRGFALVMGHFDYSRAAIGLQCLGAARASLEEAAAYAKERHAFGKPIAAFQGVSFPLAEHATLVEAARWLCYRTLWLRQEGLPHTAEAAMCKWWAPKVAKEAIEACLLVHGHSGYSDELPFQQRLRDVFGYLIGDGTAEIQKLVIARHLIGREVQDR